MNQESILIAAGVIVVAVVVYMLLHKRKVSEVMESNNNVIPLLQQRATQMKVVKLQQATQSNAAANDQLQALVLSYKDNKINIKQYNDQLDKMLNTLKVEL